MALLKIQTTVNPATGTAIASPGSAYIVYNTDNINWGTLASKTGSGGSAFSLFDYTLPGGGVGKATVRASVGDIIAKTGASTVG